MIGAIVAGSVISGAMGMMAGNKTAKASQQAAQMSTEEMRRQYDLTREDQAPWLNTGRNALAQLSAEMGVPYAGQQIKQEGDSVNSPMSYEAWKSTYKTRLPWGVGFKKGSGISYTDGQYINLNDDNHALIHPNDPVMKMMEDDKRRAYEEYVSGFPAESETGGVKPEQEYIPAPKTPMYGEFNPGFRPEFNAGEEFKFNLEGDKGYQFARDEAIRSANRALASQGMRNSGNRLAEISDRVTGLASTYANDAYNRQLGAYNTNYGRRRDIYGADVDKYNRALGRYQLGVARNQDMYGRSQDRLNRLSAMAGVGQSTANALGNMGYNTSSSISNAWNNNAINQSNAAMIKANSLNNAVQGGIENYITYEKLKNSNTGTNYWGN